MKKLFVYIPLLLICITFGAGCHADILSDASNAFSVSSPSMSPVISHASSASQMAVSSQQASAPDALEGIIGEAWGFKDTNDDYTILILKSGGEAILQKSQYFYTGTYTSTHNQITMTLNTQQDAYEWGEKNVPPIEPAERICIFTLDKGEDFDSIHPDAREGKQYVILTLIGGDRMFENQRLEVPTTFNYWVL